jgi:hypothetical protein
MVAVEVLIIHGAGDQGVFRFLQGALPGLRIGTDAWLTMSILETAHK